jgi:hypothetical protein
MLFKAVYPALVLATPPRRPTPTLCVIRRETEIEIPEVAVGDAPHVMTVHGNYVREVADWGGPVPVRQIGDRFYRPLLTVDQFTEALSDPMEPTARKQDRVLARADVFEGLRSTIFKELWGYQGPAMRFWPTNIEHFLRQATSPGSNLFSAATAQFLKDSGKVKLDDAALAQADRFHDRLLHELSEHVVIDGHVWRETLEPVYVVNVTSTMAAVFPESLARFPQCQPDLRAFRASDHFFAADSKDEAIEFARIHARNPADLEMMLRSTGDFIEIVDPSFTPRADTIRLGLHATAVSLRVRLENARMTDAGLAALRSVKKALDESDARTGISPDLEDAIRRVIMLHEENPRFIDDRLADDFVESLRLHLHRQDDAACTVPMIGGPKP